MFNNSFMRAGPSNMPAMPNGDSGTIAAPIDGNQGFGGMGSGGRMMAGSQPAGQGLPYSQLANPPQSAMQQALAAYFAQAHPQMGQQIGSLQGIPYGMPQMGQFGQPMGGYDSSGINPHGMYNQGNPMTPPMGFPQNPGGFQAMRNLGFGGR